MNFLSRLQRRLGFLSIPGLGRYIVGLQVLCFALVLAGQVPAERLALDPAAVARGEYWRLLSFLAIPSLSPFSVLLAVFYFFFQWTVFEALEAEWGAFRLTLYCGLGWLCALAFPLGLYFLSAGGISLPSSGGWWALSIQLAFATLFPNYTVLIYFILPLKMRWVAWGIAAFIAFHLLSTPAGLRLGEAALLACGLLNYLLFFAPSLVLGGLRAGRAAAGRRDFESAKRRAERSLPSRACAGCGAGSGEDLRLCTCPACGEEGRFWCLEHLRPHLEPAPPGGGQAGPKKTKRKG